MSVREKAGLGSPPSSFYNNRSESINKLLKKHVQHQKSSLPEFVRQLYHFIQDQGTNMKKACVHVGDWHVDDVLQVIASMLCLVMRGNHHFQQVYKNLSRHHNCPVHMTA